MTLQSLDEPLAAARRCRSAGAALADAGASGLFVPGLASERRIGQVAERSPLRVDVMVSAGARSLARRAALGVAWVSHGPHRLAMRALEDAARAALARI